MTKKPEPKFVVTYTENPLPVEEQERLYKMFIMHLVRVVKEQEALEENKKVK